MKLVLLLRGGKTKRGKTNSNTSTKESGPQRRQKREENVQGRGDTGEGRSGPLNELKLAQLEKDVGWGTSPWIL